MYLKGFIAILLAITLGGCSEDSKPSSGTMTPLTAEQKNELKGFSQSVNNVGTATTQASQKKHINQKKSSGDITLQTAQIGTEDLFRNQSVINTQPRRREKIDFIEKELDQCQFSNNIEDLADSNNPNVDPEEILKRLEEGIYFNVNGNACPLNLKTNARLVINRQTGSIQGSFGLNFLINDASIVDVARFEKLKISGSMSGQGRQDGSASISLGITGEVAHLDKGLVKMTLDAAQDQAASGNVSATMRMTYSFRDFSAIGDILTVYQADTGTETTIYYVNGEKVTEQEFYIYFLGTDESQANHSKSIDDIEQTDEQKVN
ncbi:MAG: hypothetical protein KDD40_12770, partial [Bdellovibrionales bacterium]|nr:hypothetical protein [Bdellovibrionales bacterium]